MCRVGLEGRGGGLVSMSNARSNSHVPLIDWAIAWVEKRLNANQNKENLTLVLRQKLMC